ncbi:ATP-binding cassette domain-containing protein [Mariprofundus sp. KV]|uniref:ATP-binding cassette domain-containing protein n=1 Tax=Mariprofundus sp. KV TaxID=2608715 RepID=UPI0015A0D041|nr:ATP-binding cassette domain-containing protein [Mariprofundus sp. KV]NWF35177.1 ATP-binding cassette domain-containing protein [Mariprofundus sp. KV]
MNSDPRSEDTTLTLRDASQRLAAEAGEIILLTGAVGSGKSLWLKRLAGVTDLPNNTSATIAGKKPGKAAGETLMLFDRQPPLWLGQRVGEELCFGLRTPPASEVLTAVLSAWRLESLSPSAELSSLNRLQAMRLSLATMALAEPKLALLDSPTDSLPETDAITLRDDITAWAERSKTTVVVASNRWQDWQSVATQHWQVTSRDDLPQRGAQA